MNHTINQIRKDKKLELIKQDEFNTLDLIKIFGGRSVQDPSNASDSNCLGDINCNVQNNCSDNNCSNTGNCG